MSNEVVDYETVDGVLNQFAKRDPAGYLVWGSKISLAYRAEVKNRENESRAANNLNDVLNIEVKRLTADNASLRALVKELADTLDEYFDDDRIRALVAKAKEAAK